MARSKRPRPSAEPQTAHIDSLSKDCRGVAHREGKAVFIDGALPGEDVRFAYISLGRRYDEGRCLEVLKPAAERVEPACAHYAACGGCSLQHLDPAAQISAKQSVLEENFRRIAKVEPQRWLAPLTGPAWGYRRKARLGVRYWPREGQVIVGFRNKQGRGLANIRRCEVLHPAIGERLEALAEVLGKLEAREAIPQVEVACGDAHCTLNIRHMQPLSEQDLAHLVAFAQQHDLQIELQPKGPDTIHPLWPAQPELHYELPEYGLCYPHRSSDFTQVNAEMNRRMVPAAIALLELKSTDRVLDLYCGIGNFSLPMARTVHEVIGVEGVAAMARRAQEIAELNGTSNAHFHAANLDEPFQQAPWFRGGFDAALLDPPRSGALVAVETLAQAEVPRIVYVSCHPASLARDAEALVHTHGYTLKAAGVMDMFPHTAHVESIALFEKEHGGSPHRKS